MKTIALAVTLLIFFSSSRCFADSVIVMVVPHAETMEGEEDVSLSEVGVARSRELAAIAKALDVSTAYHSATRRSWQMVQPIAAFATTQSYNKPTAEWVKSVLESKPRAVLIVGDPNTVPEIVERFGGKKVQVRDDEFDKLILLSVDGATVTTVQMPYGASVSPAKSNSGIPASLYEFSTGEIATHKMEESLLQGRTLDTTELTSPISIIAKELAPKWRFNRNQLSPNLRTENWEAKRQFFSQESEYEKNVLKLVEKSILSETVLGRLQNSPYTPDFIIGDPVQNQDAEDAFFTTVYVGWDTDTDKVCSGIVVAPNVVLTAKHCQEELPNYIYTARSFFPPRPTAYIRLEADSLAHPNLDLALLKLSANVTFQPARLADENSLSTFSNVTVAGYGYSEEISAQSRYGIGAGTRRRVTVPIRSYVNSDEQAERFQAKRDFEFVIGGTLAGAACFGDSGGPVYVDVGGAWRLIGITSGGVPETLWQNPDKACGNGSKTVRCDTSSVRTWINQGIAALQN